MLRIVFGYKSTDRNETPEVLYLGHDGRDAQAAIDAAPAEIVRFERVEGVRGFPGRRSKIAADASADPKTELEHYTVKELKGRAERAGVDLNRAHTKKEIIAALRAAGN